MSKTSRERSLSDNEAKAVARMLRVSPQKLNLLAQLIRGKKVAAALENGEPVNTILGPVKFDAKGDIADPHFDINQWHDGKFTAIEP